MAGKNQYRYIVVGAGIAGLSAARAIRERDTTGSLLLVNREDRIPYKRTKISKKLAAGFGRDEFALEPAEWYRENGIELVTGESVVEIDTKECGLRLGSGRKEGWERLVLAPGASPSLPVGIEVSDSEGIHVLRTALEVERLREGLEGVRRVIIVGNGVLGVEAAEQLRLLGKEVVLIGSGPRLLTNRLNSDLSDLLASRLETEGVELHTNERVESVDREGENFLGGLSVRTAKGMVIGDLVLFATGVRPDIDSAQRAGIAVGHGILVDEALRTSQPNVYAAGDAAEHAGGYISFLWHAAELQGEIAGANAAGDSLRHECPPFRMKCEVYGEYYFSMDLPRSEEGFTVRVEREGPLYRSLYYRDGGLRGAVMANDKERAKLYVRAVRERWSEKDVRRRIPLSEGSDALK